MSQIEFEKTVVDRLARIETLLEHHIENTAEHHRDHERRLRSVESECKLYRAAWTMAAAFAAWLGYHITLH